MLCVAEAWQGHKRLQFEMKSLPFSQARRVQGLGSWKRRKGFHGEMRSTVGWGHKVQFSAKACTERKATRSLSNFKARNVQFAFQEELHWGQKICHILPPLLDAEVTTVHKTLRPFLYTATVISACLASGSFGKTSGHSTLDLRESYSSILSPSKGKVSIALRVLRHWMPPPRLLGLKQPAPLVRPV